MHINYLNWSSNLGRLGFGDKVELSMELIQHRSFWLYLHSKSKIHSDIRNNAYLLKNCSELVYSVVHATICYISSLEIVLILGCQHKNKH